MRLDAHHNISGYDIKHLYDNCVLTRGTVFIFERFLFLQCFFL